MKYIISAGGTGGHLYPALALAEYIKTQDEMADFLFVGTTDRLEATVVPNMGYKYKGLKVKGLTGNIFEKFKNALIFLKSLSSSKKILKEYKPDIVIGFGGYPSASIVLSASRMKIPTIIHEQNSIIGLTNKILINKVDKIICCYQKAFNAFPKEKTLLLGNPRASVVSQYKFNDIHEIYNIPADRKTVVIVMGSLGSESINNMMIDSLKKMENDNFNIIYITGKKYYENMKEKMGTIPSNVLLVDYTDDMPSLINSCDLIVSRAGATTLSEITALGAASLLIPSPYVVANHQEFNAKELVDEGAADWILEKDLTADSFCEKIRAMMRNQYYLNVIRNSAKKLGTPNACEDFYNEIKNILEKGD